MNLIMEYTPLGLIALAVGYLFMTRPATRECDAKHLHIDSDLSWIKQCMWGLAQKHGVDVVPPPERDDEAA